MYSFMRPLLLGADNPMALLLKGGRYQFIRPASIMEL
jgi:hypothetical protein